MSKYLNLYDVCADHPEAEKERQELCNDVITLRARIAELEKECEYDQRNAAMSQAESVKAYERIEEFERLLKCSVDLENEAHHQLIAERAKVERLREALEKAARDFISANGTKPEWWGDMNELPLSVIGGLVLPKEPQYKFGFYELWESINAARGYGWYVNPWVFAVEFKRVDGGEK